MATPRASTGKRKNPTWVRLGKQLFVGLACIAFLILIAGMVLFLPVYREASEDVNNLDRQLQVQNSKPSVIVSRDGKILFSVATERRTLVDVSKLPSHIKYAIVAAEDRRFFDHGGVDFRSLLRAITTSVVDRRASQGGSTIEMQLAKVLVNGRERSFNRKLKDIAVAQQVGNLKSKDEILNLYANAVYYGEGAYGIESAAQVYFNKEAKNLTVGEAAMLSRCIRTPSRDNPIKDFQGSIDRRNYVLNVMREEGWIKRSQYDEAIRETPKVNKSGATTQVFFSTEAGYFVRQCLDQFEKDFPGYDLKTGGYRIETTLDFELQKVAVKAVRDTLREYKYAKVNDAAFVLVDSEGKILAEVGGPDFNKRQYNTVIQGHRQPGSSFKPFIYASALKDNVLDIEDNVSNEEINEDSYGKPWHPQNYGKTRWGNSMPLRTAFANSVNLAAIHTLRKVGARKVVSYAKDIFGFRSKLSAFDSLALGTSNVRPIEMAEAYSVFMLQGDRVRPFPILKVIGPDGTELREYYAEKFKGVLDPRICGEMDQLLEGVVARGTATEAQVVENARGKTGTTNDNKDAWFCGYTDGLLGIGWVGNTSVRNGQASALPMSKNVFGGTVTVKIWRTVMLAARKKLFKPPTPSSLEAQDRKKVEPPVAPIRDGTETDLPDTTSNYDPGSTPGDGFEMPPLEPAPKPNPTSGQKPGPKPVTPPVVPPSDPVVEPPKPRPTEPDSESGSESVEVCADSGERATAYCPETVTKRFPRGRAPRKTCPLHRGQT